MCEKCLVPKLRFDGFTDEWKTSKLGKIVDFLDNKRIPLNEEERRSQKDIYPYYGASGIIDYVEDYIFDEELILLGEDGTIGVNLSFGKYWVNNHAHVLKAKENINQYLLSEYLKTIHFEKYNTGTIQPKLNKETCKTIPIILPNSLEEQEKIAGFLSKLDKKINLLNQELDQIKDFKRYLLENIFSQKLRFKGFTDEWESSTLGKISRIGKGFTPSTSNSNYWDGDIDWLSISDMNQGKYINTTTKKITLKGTKNKKIIKKGTLLMSFKLSIGKLGILNKDMYTNEAICNFQWKNKDILTEYMYYYLNSINIMKYGSQAAKGITLNNDSLTTIPVLLPSLKEQKFISDCISKVDIKIDLLSSQIVQMEKFKKGLLQQMFI